MLVHTHWERSGDPIKVKPIAVLLPWVWAKDKYVQKYASLLNTQGWDCLVCSPPMLAMWVGLWGASNAVTVATVLGEELLAAGERPVVFYVFSGAAKVLQGAVFSRSALKAWSAPSNKLQFHFSA